MTSPHSDHESWNEAMARRYDPDAFITKSGFLIRRVEALRVERSCLALDCRPGDQVLDLGCGPGNIMERLEGARIVGVDLSVSMLEQARQRIHGRPRFEVIKGDAEALDFPDSTFDRIVCSELLEHVPAPLRVLSEIRRVARAGARVVVTIPNEGLINRTKRLILFLGLKRWIAGGYVMSDDMLDEWHRMEVSPAWVRQAGRDFLRPAGVWSIPWPGLSYHWVLAFDLHK